MKDTLNFLKSLANKSTSDEKYVSFFVRLSKPIGLGYTINSFLNEEKTTDSELFKKKLEHLGGIESNFSYDLRGEIDHPDEFKSMQCEVMVNPLAGSDYLEYTEKGQVGDGWYANERLLFRLYLSPQMARDIIIRQLLATFVEDDVPEEDPLRWIKLQTARPREYVPEDPNNNSDDWAWMHLRLDVVNFFHPTGPIASDDQVSYSIIRVYC